jgi:hypothetical protein
MAPTGEAAPLESLELDVDAENQKRVIEMLRPHYTLWDGRLDLQKRGALYSNDGTTDEESPV